MNDVIIVHELILTFVFYYSVVYIANERRHIRT